MSSTAPQRPGTAAIRRLTSRLLALLVPLTAPAWAHAAVAQSAALAGWWEMLTGIAIGASALWLVGTGLAGTDSRQPAAALAATVALALVSWPLAVVDPGITREGLPWLWLILPLACAAVASLGSVALGAFYGGAVGTAYAFIRLGDIGGRGAPTVAALEGLLLASMSVGLTLVVVAGVQAADRLDAAAARSAEASALASRAATADRTRRELDAVVHDTVLAALHAAVRQASPQQVPELAADALRRLEEAEAAEWLREGPVPDAELGARLERGLAAVAPAADLTVVPFGELPPAAARAVADATLEAARNARRHGGGGGVPPYVSVWLGPGPPGSGATVEARVSDDGIGFDPDLVPPARMGLAVSVVERMRRAGGDATVRTSPGQGTTVRLTWPLREVPDDSRTRRTVRAR